MWTKRHVETCDRNVENKTKPNQKVNKKEICQEKCIYFASVATKNAKQIEKPQERTKRELYL